MLTFRKSGLSSYIDSIFGNDRDGREEWRELRIRRKGKKTKKKEEDDHTSEEDRRTCLLFFLKAFA